MTTTGVANDLAVASGEFVQARACVVSVALWGARSTVLARVRQTHAYKPEPDSANTGSYFFWGDHL